MNRRSLLVALPLVALAPLALLPLRNQLVPALRPVVTGLANPWGMAFLPDGSLLLTERPGRLRRVTFPDGNLEPTITGTPEVDAEGQGGLLGIAIDPDFTSNRRVYISFSERREGGNATAVFRGKLNAASTALEEGQVIFRQNLAIESVDLCRRLAAEGTPTRFTPAATIGHVGGASTAMNHAPMQREMFRSLARYTRRHGRDPGLVRLRLAVIAIASAEFCRDVIVRAIPRPRGTSSRPSSGWRAIVGDAMGGWTR